MLSEEDVQRIRNLKDELDQEEKNLQAAIRETENAKNRVRQVKTSIRPAARTRFTTWLTNSDPDEHRRYREAIDDHKNQIQLVRHLKPRVAAKDSRITSAVEECLERSDKTYQGIMTQRRTATTDLESCDRLRARSAGVRSQVDAALTQTQQLRDRDAKDARKEMDLTVARITDATITLKSELMALAPRMRTYGSFSTSHIHSLRAEFSGRRSDLHTRRTELTKARAALSTIHEALTSASKTIANHRRDLDRKRRAIVQDARTQALGS